MRDRFQDLSTDTNIAHAQLSDIKQHSICTHSSVCFKLSLHYLWYLISCKCCVNICHQWQIQVLHFGIFWNCFFYISKPCLVDSLNVKPKDTESQLYLLYYPFHKRNLSIHGFWWAPGNYPLHILRDDCIGKQLGGLKFKNLILALGLFLMHRPLTNSRRKRHHPKVSNMLQCRSATTGSLLLSY